ncbi:uncharacterized protein A1O9_08602 [Exophiala aquamarina CBS 119918]|uniref:Uncharacterized protein n=1 Tax=Exophiala aquamarina CBS 119918 TaxID=1182545 RepID=A0A072PHE2_9EURO|nr:uncharacterized protein A1O9_08602 [Exophiala aquamarina CBS 119918]KEF54950.1 hypothetical protein A1O9_08602 [Exophiala aquamarina CBS 119918]
MHLLTETAISDSREYEVLSFDEVEQLKRERIYLRGKIDTTKRKLGLESKLRDAAQSLNRLYSTREKGESPNSPTKKRRSFLGARGSPNESVARADDELTASNKKVEELTLAVKQLEKKYETTERRILEHTAGILQMTHRGLKKNIRRTELPRSPESMTSQPIGRGSGMTDGIDDFDERSLYQVPDYVTEFGPAPGPVSKGRPPSRDAQPIDDFANRLQELNSRLHTMITQAGPHEHFDPPPQPTDEHVLGRVGAQIQAYLGYMSQGLDAMQAAQARATAAVEKSLFDSEDQVEDVNIRLQDMLERTNSVSHSPLLPQEEPRGKDLQSQLAFSSVVLERLNSRVETLIEQKDILTRQIQQQRELNSKSDAQRDAHIHEITEELEQLKKLRAVHEEESQHSRDQINLLMEQLDNAKQENILLEQQRGVNDGKAVEAERSARKEMEDRHQLNLKTKQDEFAALLSEFNQLRAGTESSSRQGLLQVQELEAAKAQAEAELAKAKEEVKVLESEVARAQTDLTVVKAELDGAYGTRAQRAADVSLNPAVQKEIDDLNARNADLESQLEFLTTQHQTKGAGSAELQNKVNALQQELKDTIEEYEVMTKQSIDDEKERDHLEENVDTLQQRCETLEMQLNEEKLKWLGVKAGSPTEVMSTMVLKNEFKKMMRETRAENIKTIRVSDDLEGIIRGGSNRFIGGAGRTTKIRGHH